MAKPKEQKKADENAAKFRSRFGKNANYDADQDQPANRMGASDYANLPPEPIYGEYMMPQYRDGIINSFDAGVEQISGISENRRKR